VAAATRITDLPNSGDRERLRAGVLGHLAPDRRESFVGSARRLFHQRVLVSFFADMRERLALKAPDRIRAPAEELDAVADRLDVAARAAAEVSRTKRGLAIVQPLPISSDRRA